MRVRPALGIALLVPALAAGPALAIAPAADAKAAGAVAARPPTPRPIAGAYNSRAARSSRTATQAKTGGVQVQIDSFAKPWVTDGGSVELNGAVVNQSGQPISGNVLVQLWYGRRLTSRGQISTENPPPVGSFGQPQKLSGPLPTGGSLSWKLSLKASVLTSQSDFGVYPLRVVASDYATGKTLAEQATFVVFAPKNFNSPANPKRTKISWVLPLMDQPKRIRNTAPSNGAVPLFQSNQLDEEFGPDGRLTALLDAGKSQPPAKSKITWAIDPALLADAADMSNVKGYQVDRTKQRLPKSLNADSWLQGLKTSTNPYFLVPYGDPDAVALVRQGQKRSELGDLLTDSINQEQPAKALLGRTPDLNIFWPADGAADNTTLARFSQGPADTAYLLSGTQLPSTVQDEKYTPSATTVLRVGGKQRTAIAYDTTISDAISADSSSLAGKTQAEQLYLAQTALMTAEVGSVSRSLVIAPDRHWNPQNDLAKSLINDTVGAPWLQPVQLRDLLKDTPTSERRRASYTRDERGRELGSGYLSTVADTWRQAKGLAGIYVKPRDDFETGLLGAASSSFRNGGPAFGVTVKSEVAGTISKVHLLNQRNVAIAGRSAQVPYTMANDLPDPVHVLVEVTSQSNRVQIAANSRVIPVTIEAGHRTPINVGMRSLANGVTPVQVNVFTLDHKVTLSTVTTYVSTAGYVRTALIITAVGLAVLFGGVGVRFTRARRRHKQAEEHDAAGHPAADGEHTVG